MQTNQYGQTYSGNDDFRGWLAAGNRAVALPGETGIYTDIVNNHIGNDGGIDTNDQALADAARQNYNYWLSQRQAQAENPTDVNSNGNGNGNSTTSAEDAATKRRMIGIYDRQIGDINNNINSLDARLNNELAGVRGEYDQYKNEQQSAYDQAQNNYDQSTLQNKQNLQANRNTITNKASSAMRGLLRILGAMGAGGSSVARYNVPEMVRNQVNDEYNNAGKTFAQNQQNLDTNWGNYKINAENDRKKLEDWYNGQVKSKQQENEERKQSLLSDLVTAYGNRAQYGGDYGNNVNDAYNRIAQSRDRINNLGQYATPNYTGTTAVYNAPDLDSYNANTASVDTNTTESNTSASSPLLTALQGLTKRKQNN